MKKIIILLIISLALPNLVWGQKLPENLEDFKAMGERILEKIGEWIRAIGQEIVKISKKIWGWLVNLFESYIFPFFKFIWQKISDFFLKIIKTILENLWLKIKGRIK